jgi:2-(1,2-epoxy-1,2-dihydrophenyl)acetyl-CoA isomerase
MAQPGVLIDRDGDVATVVINRPERANALDSQAASEIAAAVETTSDARAVILTGAGRAFCAGGDLDEIERWSTMPAEDVGAALYGSFQSMIRAVRASDAVVVAAINGAAVGAGLDLALACDLRVAARGAKLGQVWVGLGLIPGTGGAYLTQALAGPTRAAELLLTGEVLSADDALEWGLVNEVVPDEELADRARALVERVLRHPRDGVIANKRAIVLASQDAVEAALAHAAEVQPLRFTSDEFRRAVAAAKQRRAGSS